MAYHRIMLRALFVSVLLILTVEGRCGKELAVTIDDLPFAYGRHLPDSVKCERFRDILEVLKKHDLKVIAFVVGSRIETGYQGLLDELVSDGHIVGNHTYTHPDLNATRIDWYQNDITKCQTAIDAWQGPVKYFRYPYLHRGPTTEKHREVSLFLSDNSFVTVPVSIDNDDWYYNKGYSDALRERDIARADSIGKVYIEHMHERTHHFDSLAVSKLGRDIKHILLIHMNEINSVYLDTLLTWYAGQGWTFITPVQALTDSIYRIHDTYVGEWGLSWLLRF